MINVSFKFLQKFVFNFIVHHDAMVQEAKNADTQHATSMSVANAISSLR